MGSDFFFQHCWSKFGLVHWKSNCLEISILIIWKFAVEIANVVLGIYQSKEST